MERAREDLIHWTYECDVTGGAALDTLGPYITGGEEDWTVEGLRHLAHAITQATMDD